MSVVLCGYFRTNGCSKYRCRMGPIKGARAQFDGTTALTALAVCPLKYDVFCF